MLAAPTTLNITTSNAKAVTTAATEKKHQKSIFDTYDSPFYTPSLFVTNAPIKNNEQFKKYDTFYNSNKDDYYLFRQASSPGSFFNIMADIESSDTRSPSPKHDIVLGDDHDQRSPLLLYHQQQQRQQQQQIEPTTAVINFNNTYDYADSSCGNAYQQPNYGYYPEISTTESLRQKLKEANDMNQRLLRQLNVMHMEIEKKRVTVANIKASLINKDLECQEQEQRLSKANQLVDVQSKKLNEKMAELALYQSLVKSKGLDLPTPESSDAYKLHRYPENNVKSSVLDTTASIKLNLSNTETDKSVYNVGDTTEYVNERKSSSSSSEYRRIIGKNANANWDSLVDRITKETDQQASIFMQQKLKCATQEQKHLIFKAILKQAYALMTNRFGNFLVQKLLELGTEEQIQALADTMSGHILELTCEPFGCHVVQKALDYVNETSRASLVSELFERIPETITHKYACHVWQKVFEIRWSTLQPPHVMAHVHASVKGRWAHVALDETGSLVIQNIFENLTEPDKRPVIDEVLTNAVSIAKGQWGNWVIQHILEQAERSQDREAAFDIVLKEAVQLSMDQFASKVVEKALRIGGDQFLFKFVKRISNNDSVKRPRMALIDIASDQYGNYVVQWLINNACEEQKLYICRLIKRHMVSLRGSKYGQRVAFLVEKVLRNQEFTTYPSTN